MGSQSFFIDSLWEQIVYPTICTILDHTTHTPHGSAVEACTPRTYIDVLAHCIGPTTLSEQCKYHLQTLIMILRDSNHEHPFICRLLLPWWWVVLPVQYDTKCNLWYSFLDSVVLDDVIVRIFSTVFHPTVLGDHWHQSPLQSRCSEWFLPGMEDLVLNGCFSLLAIPVNPRYCLLRLPTERSTEDSLGSVWCSVPVPFFGCEQR